MLSTRCGRRYARYHVPFIHNTWKSPETLRIISDLAGIDVVPVFDYDIAHVNVSGPSVPGFSPLPEDRVSKPAQKTNTEKPRAEDKNDSIISWHNDSYAFDDLKGATLLCFKDATSTTKRY
ncbi:hypothetical protein V2G26_006946 [Clonostachys chloroleuca]